MLDESGLDEFENNWLFNYIHGGICFLDAEVQYESHPEDCRSYRFPLLTYEVTRLKHLLRMRGDVELVLVSQSDNK